MAERNRLAQFVADLTNVQPAHLHVVGQFAVDLIVTRTKAGLDADRHEFAPYTPEYAAKKAGKIKTLPAYLIRIPLSRKGSVAAGALKAAQTAAMKPNLVASGHMLGSITPAVGPDSVTLSFAGAVEGDKAAGNSHKRDFFDIRDSEELDAVAQALADALLPE